MGNEHGSEKQWVGLDIFDLDGHKIGTVEDALYSETQGDLEWLVTGTTSGGADKILLPAGSVRHAGDRVSVEHTKERVEGAPKVEVEAAPTEAEKGSLCRYYGLQYAGASPDEGCEEIADQRPGG